MCGRANILATAGGDAAATADLATEQPADAVSTEQLAAAVSTEQPAVAVGTERTRVRLKPATAVLPVQAEAVNNCKFEQKLTIPLEAFLKAKWRVLTREV